MLLIRWRHHTEFFVFISVWMIFFRRFGLYKMWEQVRFLVEGASSDLRATGACYHVDCSTTFLSPASITAAQNASKVNENEDPVFDSIDWHAAFRPGYNTDSTPWSKVSQRKKARRTLFSQVTSNCIKKLWWWNRHIPMTSHMLFFALEVFWTKQATVTQCCPH